MSNEMAKARLAELMDSVRSGMESIARAQEEQARLTATASAAAGRVTVVVNANSVVIEVKFADNVDELSYAEIARAVTTAAQNAAAEVQRKTRELLSSLKRGQARMPKLSELVPGLPDVPDMVPTPPEVSTAPPESHDRMSTGPAPEDTPMEFSNVEQWNHEKSSQDEPSIVERSW
ncbi:YbaB/EbfC family nucleoid-associated protein [Nocardia pseudovaccinii]|uniref:YbaB/EbfC family nucleoid-associated protein n=1 Tax=Nocardia pseudovaccinii TaxID=189540 RepID=UPI0007A3AB4E|nr:YbaB/EbfC family nucleoid-associated protein [Nocardia pseudovaccinii]